MRREAGAEPCVPAAHSGTERRRRKRRPARILGVETRRAVVVEDAVAEIRAGRDGGFGLVIGLAGPDDADEMLDNGADVVVADLGEMAG